ncbi:hypothetical protein HRR83_007061 [Exophiala dermatitidis]|uniref:Uncharacterized protein n=1 Tax=Exophiala dermatitidis TaxID=5970 RepID=A0AAN6IT32_EXODE|nr:hypothetical protein HRR73_006100 [Exophiala dermatitidis]KAJ4512581.1 hypothetical protein HRR74_006279 [Exophiala dermatitidis]KAJ4542376.1 hypothetical protein HRR77_005583 [Exophiala dermatitidis]KAJ4548063.1 hypothetical protein HRR76_000680 [Exophiala dermatitidis]KAJ4568178.1 hypothetical protein HRR82_008081 [Exophiala dermatitidis]
MITRSISQLGRVSENRTEPSASAAPLAQTTHDAQLETGFPSTPTEVCLSSLSSRLTSFRPSSTESATATPFLPSSKKRHHFNQRLGSTRLDLELIMSSAHVV